MGRRSRTGPGRRGDVVTGGRPTNPCNVVSGGIMLACLHRTTAPFARRSNRRQNVECVFSTDLNCKTVMPDLARRTDLVTDRFRGDTDQGPKWSSEVETVVATVRAPHREPGYQGPSNPTLPNQLADALRDGPFHRGLALAVEVSGLSLQRLQHRLAEAGVHLSTTTLSYWRTGRSRPERPDSLRGVQVLERVLSLPAGALVGLLGPRRPRGRWVRPEPGVVRLEQLLPMSNVAAKLARELDMPQVGRASCRERVSTIV